MSKQFIIKKFKSGITNHISGDSLNELHRILMGITHFLDVESYESLSNSIINELENFNVLKFRIIEDIEEIRQNDDDEEVDDLILKCMDAIYVAFIDLMCLMINEECDIKEITLKDILITFVGGYHKSEHEQYRRINEIEEFLKFIDDYIVPYDAIFSKYDIDVSDKVKDFISDFDERFTSDHKDLLILFYTNTCIKYKDKDIHIIFLNSYLDYEKIPFDILIKPIINIHSY